MIWLILAASTVLLAVAFLLRRHTERTLTALNMTGEVVYSDRGVDDQVLVSHIGFCRQATAVACQVIRFVCSQTIHVQFSFVQDSVSCQYTYKE